MAKPTKRTKRTRPAPKKRGPGRPTKPIDWDEVDRLCSLQCTAREIAASVGVDVSTFHNAIKRERGAEGFTDYTSLFAEKRQAGLRSLRRAQFETAIKGNPTMQIWLGKQWLDQRDVTALEHSGPGGGPIPIANVAAARAKLAKLLGRKQKGADAGSDGDSRGAE